jgi:hypothetical protein
MWLGRAVIIVDWLAGVCCHLGCAGGGLLQRSSARACTLQRQLSPHPMACSVEISHHARIFFVSEKRGQSVWRHGDFLYAADQSASD